MGISYFDIDKELDVSSKNALDRKLNELFQHEEPGKYAVILHNDPINGVDFVTGVIKKVFGYSTGIAIWLMLKAHFTGKSRLWCGPYRQAREKMSSMISFGPDPNMVHKGAETLRVTVEKNE